MAHHSCCCFCVAPLGQLRFLLHSMPFIFLHLAACMNNGRLSQRPFKSTVHCRCVTDFTCECGLIQHGLVLLTDQINRILFGHSKKPSWLFRLLQGLRAQLTLLYTICINLQHAMLCLCNGSSPAACYHMRCSGFL